MTSRRLGDVTSTGDDAPRDEGGDGRGLGLGRRLVPFGARATLWDVRRAKGAAERAVGEGDGPSESDVL